jgi:hypothetical protein
MDFKKSDFPKTDLSIEEVEEPEVTIGKATNSELMGELSIRGKLVLYVGDTMKLHISHDVDIVTMICSAKAIREAILMDSSAMNALDAVIKKVLIDKKKENLGRL